MIIEKIEQCAEEVLKRAGSQTAPTPVEDIAAKFQIRISRATGGEFSGMLIRKDGKALIGINNEEPEVRQRFTIAHELGHFFLHQNKDAFVDYRDNGLIKKRTPREKQANMFAAALLMPRQNLLKDFKAMAKDGFSEDELTILAQRYDVSEEAMKFRLMNLHYLS